MNKILYTLLVIFFASIEMTFAQEENTQVEITAVAELDSLKQTGKRHQSYYFIFRIKQVLDGELKDSIIFSQEIFQYFGGNSILSKIYPNYGNYCDKTGKRDVIINFSYNSKDKESFLNYKTTANLNWVSECCRKESITKLR